MKRALISVYDKTGIVEFAQGLSKVGVEILSTGGTAKKLKDAGIKVKDVSEYTGFPEMMDGRVKTLHPKIHGGILALRGNKEHMKQASDNKIEMIDIVVVNLYPFEETVTKKISFDDTIEMIDIGGPSMIRSAAKNFKDVLVVVDPADYPWVLQAVKDKKSIPLEKRKELAHKVFARTATYDSAIADYLSEETFPEIVCVPFKKKQEMRYGENPYQEAAFYIDPLAKEPGVGASTQLFGKELSYNNIMDADSALNIVKEFSDPCAAIVKHANPSGVAIKDKMEDALEAAYRADPLSAFGCIIALNRKCNRRCAEFLADKFIEVIIAPDYDSEALKLLSVKKNRRILKLETFELCYHNDLKEKITTKKVVGGILVQTRNFPKIDNVKVIKNENPTLADIEKLTAEAKKGILKEVLCVTKKQPTKEQLLDLLFAMKVCKHVKSNSVLFVKDKVTVGIGAGQMSRVDSTIIATKKSAGRAKGAVMASDAFFPFRDGVDEAAKAGITALIQPGGSLNDKEVIEAANEHGIAMIFTGTRLFLH
ncbi:MAG TPA: bifunctional phosphoribosylaminoimidazolecarboxamide formyltransferase/IMP cyclohydrolase [Candidatus Nanoarchaeia archaeon]|nr:bifunctional phosphoribosylaminoimidazolecarboxamide formyltransferase/IMP cyclohydrolase [Candidatus Nanoarchaeia archaeon]